MEPSPAAGRQGPPPDDEGRETVCVRDWRSNCRRSHSHRGPRRRRRRRPSRRPRPRTRCRTQPCRRRWIRLQLTSFPHILLSLNYFPLSL
ncbi:hypothetical protein BRC81_06445 [Halobacteriales archaeon QS_1_68_20]|nr:MAG: hypothetical protein BRC81_06445 [Halobacteriales archaeon QS_1_68_20]